MPPIILSPHLSLRASTYRAIHTSLQHKPIGYNLNDIQFIMHAGKLKGARMSRTKVVEGGKRDRCDYGEKTFPL